MYPVSQLYQDVIMDTERDTKIEGTIYLKDNSTISISDEDIIQGSLYISEQCIDGDDIDIGSVYMSELGVSIVNPPANPYSLSGARIETSFFIRSSDDEWAYCPLGIYYIDEIKRNDNYVDLKAFDGLSKFDEQDLIGIVQLGTAFTLVSSCCSKSGISLSTDEITFNNFPNGSLNLSMKDIKKIETCRDLIMWIAQLTCTFVRMNRNGQLEFVLLGQRDPITTITTNDRFSIDVSDFSVNVTKISMKVDDKTFSDGTSEGKILELDSNPFVTKSNISNVLENISGVLSGLEYVPFDCDYVGDPALQPGDFVTLEETSHLTSPKIISMITNHTWSYRRSHSLKGIGKTNNNVSSQAQKAMEAVADSVNNYWQINNGDDTPNMLAGHDDNLAPEGVIGATIGGGGSDGSPNRIYGDYATIGGGANHEIFEAYSTIGGGEFNMVYGDHSFVGGGRDNAAGTYSTVGGGENNKAYESYGFIGGGKNNRNNSINSVVVGGEGNSGYGPYNFIGGGQNNQTGNPNSVVVGGKNNSGYGENGFIGGGQNNQIGGINLVLCGGERNGVYNSHASIVGGYKNSVTGEYGFVGGGKNNLVYGGYSGVLSGEDNLVSVSHSAAFGKSAIMTRMHGGVAQAYGKFRLRGDAQREKYILRRQTIDSTPEFINSDNMNDIFPVYFVTQNEEFEKFYLKFNVLACTSTKMKMWKMEFLVDNQEHIGPVVIGTPVKTVVSESEGATNWDIAIDYSTTTDLYYTFKNLGIKAFGEENQTINWVADLEILSISPRDRDIVVDEIQDAVGEPMTAGTGISACYSADSVYLIVGHYGSPYISIYKRDGDSYTKLPNPASLPASAVDSCCFSPDGVYLAVVHYSSPYITIYKRNGDTFTKLSNPSSLPTGGAYGVDFSPDGVYLAISHYNNPYITIYKRSGDTFAKLSNPIGGLPEGNPLDGNSAICFSPDGIHLALSRSNVSPYIIIYKRNGDTFTKLSNPIGVPTMYGHIKYSHNGEYFVVCWINYGRISIFKRDGDTYTELTDVSDLSSVGYGVHFSPDDTYLIITPLNFVEMIVYRRDGDSFTKLPRPVLNVSSGTSDSAISPDGTHIVMLGNDSYDDDGVIDTSRRLIVYKWPLPLSI